MKTVGHTSLDLMTLTCVLIMRMTYISRSSDFVIFLRIFDRFFGIMSQWDMAFDLKINVGHSDLYFMVQ